MSIAFILLLIKERKLKDSVFFPFFILILDRIIVGEVRGAEAVDLLQAMNTGHDGSLSTGHSNSATDLLSRLETMVLMGMDLPVAAIRQQIASAVDLIIHLGRLRDKSRKVLEITEVCGYEEPRVRLKPLFVYRYESEKLEKEGELENVAKLQAAGLDPYAES